jgi:hypothetical protein
MTQPQSNAPPPTTIDDLARAIAAVEADRVRRITIHRIDQMLVVDPPAPELGDAFADYACAVVLALADDVEDEVWPGQDGLDTPAGRLSTLIAECRERRR